MAGKESLLIALEQQINRAKEYIQRSEVLEKTNIDGANKLTKRIRAELKFLNELSENRVPIKQCHLSSSNLSHLGSVLDVAESLDTVIAVLKTVTWHKNKLDTQSVITIDVVSSRRWLKVVARNPIALHKSWEGQGNFGDKLIDKQAEEYVIASQQNKVDYSAPKVTFVFTQGITEKLAECLLHCGITVKGDILPNPGFDSLDKPQLVLENKLQLDDPPNLKCLKVNLDVTAMIALVSELANGSCHYQFQEQVLTDQADRERENPLLPQLNKFLEGKELYACTLAISSFKSILETLGGPNEKHRGKELLDRVTEVENNPSSRAEYLNSSARIKPRPKIVFGTGDQLQAITLSSNGAFVRAAKEQGVEFSAFVHEPRALTERKEPFATEIKDEK